MKHVLVTGGLGFIGSHLAELLVSRGMKVIVVDNCVNNTVDPREFAKVINGWVAVCSVKEYLANRTERIDAVFHLASTVGPVGVLSKSGDLGSDIVGDTVMLRDFCMDKRIKYIYVSTSEIYGDVKDWDEDSVKVFPSHYTVRSEYAAGKMTSEIAIVNKARVEDLSYTIIRPFNVAGPRQKPDFGFVLPRFVVAALTGQYLTVYGDGLQVRAFTDVRDICDAIYFLAMDFEGIFNIGNPANAMTIRDLAKMVLAMVGPTDSEIVNVDPKQLHGDLFEEVPDKIPCIAKLMELGWKPKYPIAETISDTIEYYREKIENGYYFKVI